MATPSVLTVPSMYGDGILYSGPSAYGSELASQPVDLQTDFANNSGGTITSANTFDTSGGSFDGIASRLSAFSLTVGTAYEIEIRGTTTSEGFTLGNLSASGNEYGSGFGVHRFVSLNTILWIRQNSVGTTTITHFSIRQVTQGSDFEFTRDTFGTRINEEGYIEDVPYNLAKYSENFSQFAKINATVTTNQTLAPNGTLTADKIVFNGTANARVEQNLGTVINTNNTQSVFLKTESGTASIQIGSSSVDLSTITVTSEWKRFSFTGTGSFPRIKSDSAATIFAWGFQVVAGSKPKNYLPTTDRKNLPRLNYPVYGGCPSLLLEPQRTNLIPYSTDFSNAAWSKSNITVTANNATSPEGITNATKLTESSANAVHFIQENTGAGAGTYTGSIFLKAGDRFIGWMELSDGSSSTNAYFNLQTGVLGTTATGGSWSNSSFSIQEYPNNWYRCIVTATTSNSGIIQSIAMTNNTEDVSYQGDGSSTMFIYGAQVEVGSYPTSLMPTSGGTFTRNKDQVQNSGLGTTDTFNSSEGVLYAEVENLAEDGNNKCISINDGSASNRTTIVLGTATNQIRAHVLSGGVAVFDESTFTAPTSTQFNKIVVKYKDNDFSCFVNGIKVASKNTASAPIGLDRLDLDVGNNSLEYFGNVKAVAVYKTALTDTELANLTSYNNHDLFIPYRSRMQMISADQELQCTEHDITRFL